MKYYVVSSSELSDALSAKYHQGLLEGAGGGPPIEIVAVADKTEAACRAREVEPLDVTEWPDKTVQTWVGEVKK